MGGLRIWPKREYITPKLTSIINSANELLIRVGEDKLWGYGTNLGKRREIVGVY